MSSHLSENSGVGICEIRKTVGRKASNRKCKAAFVRMRSSKKRAVPRVKSLKTLERVKRSDSNFSFDFCQRLQLLTPTAYFCVGRIVGRFVRRSIGSPATQTSFCHYGNPWRTGGNAIISNTALPPTRWHPRRAGTGHAPRASRCWRRRSNSAPVCTRIFRATKTSPSRRP